VIDRRPVGPQGHDPREGLPKIREPWLAARREPGIVTQLEFARKGVVTPEMQFVAIREGFDPEFVRSEVAHTVANPALIDEEMRHLATVLGRQP